MRQVGPLLLWVIALDQLWAQSFSMLPTHVFLARFDPQSRVHKLLKNPDPSVSTKTTPDIFVRFRLETRVGRR